MKYWLTVILFSLLFNDLQAQSISGFSFVSDSVRSYTVKFKEINNLVLIPLTFNESDTLFFILDSGAENTTLFGAEFDSPPIDTTHLRRVKVSGAGEDEAVSAFVSPVNNIRSGPILGKNINIVYIPDDFIQFSDLLGHPVHGILGVPIFHSFIIKLDYYKHEVTFYRPGEYKPKKRFTKLPLQINGNRPFIDLFVEIHPRITMTTNLLVDLGESKPLSLFLSTNEAFILPYPNYHANLGKGMNGIVTGKVARVSSVVIGQYAIRNVITAFPDQEAIQFLTGNDQRNGSVGSGVLMRFITIFDLPGNSLYLKKTRWLRQPFSYDKTGIIIVAEGDKYDILRITGLIDNTPGAKSGLQKNDIILAINGSSVKGKQLGEVLQLIEEKGKRLNFKIDRNGRTMEFDIKLNKLL